MHPDLAQAADLATWLAAAVDAWINAAPRRSQRAFAKRAGIPTGTLSNVVRGVRPLAARYVPDVAKVLELDGDEALALDKLAAVRPGDRDAIHELLAAQSFLRAQRLGDTDVAYVASWIHIAVREMSAVAGFQPDAAWIAARLWPRASVEQCAIALETLREVHPRVRDPSVQLTTGLEPAFQVAENLHQQLLDVARAAADLPRADRYLQAHVCAVPAHAVDDLKAAIDELIRQAMTIDATAAGARTELVQVSVQLVPLMRTTASP